MNGRSSLREVRAGIPAGGHGIPDWPGCVVHGTGEPVVMLHASLGSKSQWTALALRMRPRFKVIALDLWGYGDSAMPAVPELFALDDEVQLVSAHINRLVASHIRIHVVAHSYGGLVALRFAQCNSERVASLSLYEPAAFGVLTDDDEALAGARQLATRVHDLLAMDRRHHAAQAFVDFWSGDGAYASLSPMAQAGILCRMDKVVLDFQATRSWRPARNDLRKMVSPTLLLTGKRSPIVARTIVARLATALPHCRVALLDSGHMGPITDSHRVNPWFEAFVDMHAERDGAHIAASPNVARMPYPSAAD